MMIAWVSCREWYLDDVGGDEGYDVDGDDCDDGDGDGDDDDGDDDYDDDDDDDDGGDDDDDDGDDDDDFHTFLSLQVCQWAVQQISPYCTCTNKCSNIELNKQKPNVQNIAPKRFKILNCFAICFNC